MTMKTASTRFLVLTVALSVGGITVGGAEQTWTGQISDSICGASHAGMGGQIGITDQECVMQCVKSGAKYVLVTPDQVLQITNQDFKDLEAHAAQKVKVTGDLKGEAVTVTKIEPAS